MKHVIIAVHGTWGRSPSGFYHPSEDPESFCQRLLRSLEPEIPASEAIWAPFEWDHGNSHDDRLDGARELARLLNHHRQEGHRIHIVAHSHGGNVALKAIELYLGEIQLAIRRGLEGDDPHGKGRSAIKAFEPLVAAGPGANGPLAVALDDLREQVAPSNDHGAGDDSTAAPHTRLRALVKSLRNLTQSRALNKLARVIQLASVRPEVHRIDSVVTMGTPFYFKYWQSGLVSRVFGALVGAVLTAVFGAIGYYLGILFWGGLLALLPFIDFVGWNPLAWPLWLQILVVVSLLPGLIATVIEEERTKLRDTNVYFDASAISSLLASLGDARICRMLNVHAGLLDEPYLGMSVFPTLDPYIRRQVESFTRPRAWAFVPVRRRVGVSAASLPAQLMRTLWSLVKGLGALLLLILYPVRYLLHLAVGRLLKGAATKRLRAVAYGLPPMELAESRIAVNTCLVQDYFDHKSYDASQELTAPTVLREVIDWCRENPGATAAQLLDHLHRRSEALQRRLEIDRFGFLWDDSLVEPRYLESILGQHVGQGLSLADKRQILALEERGKEFFGVTGVRHSMYYDNDAVISRIGEFIKGNSGGDK